MMFFKNTCFTLVLITFCSYVHAQDQTSILGSWKSIYQKANTGTQSSLNAPETLFFNGKECHISQDSIFGLFYPFQLTLQSSYTSENNELFFDGSKKSRGSYFISKDSLTITFTNLFGDTITEYFERTDISLDTLQLLKKNKFIAELLIGNYEVKEVYMGDDALLQYGKHKAKKSVSWKSEAAILDDLNNMKTMLKYNCRKRTFKIIEINWEPAESLTEDQYASPATEFIVTPDNWYEGPYFELRLKKLKTPD